MNATQSDGKGRVEQRWSLNGFSASLELSRQEFTPWLHAYERQYGPLPRDAQTRHRYLTEREAERIRAAFSLSRLEQLDPKRAFEAARHAETDGRLSALMARIEGDLVAQRLLEYETAASFMEKFRRNVALMNFVDLDRYIARFHAREARLTHWVAFLVGTLCGALVTAFFTRLWR
jgi:hypothetical protein